MPPLPPLDIHAAMASLLRPRGQLRGQCRAPRVKLTETLTSTLTLTLALALTLPYPYIYP